jgi:putative membrane protein
MSVPYYQKEGEKLPVSANTNKPTRYESENILMMWGYDFGWGGMLLMSLGTILWIALMVVLVWALIRWINGRTTTLVPPYTSAPPTGPSALEILRQRYARGEIDTATFEQMREQLEPSSPPGYHRSDGNQPTIAGR